MKSLGTISRCTECPNRQYDSGGQYMCRKAQAPLLKHEAMPEWCPLPNDPTQIAARSNRALQGAREVLSVAMEEAGKPETSPERLRSLIRIAQEQCGAC